VRLAGQNRAGIHCSIAIDGVRDARQEADYAADTSTDDIALRRRRDDAAISRELGISHSTVREYLARIAAAGITWPLPAELTDGELEQRLFVNGGLRAGARHHVEPDWAAVVRELKRPGVNLMILWEEYRAVHSDGYAYSRHCQLFREERRLSPSMRQTHVAGDKAFVDFSGKKIPIAHPATGVVRMLRFWGAWPGLLVPDNLRSGVNKASFCDPKRYHPPQAPCERLV
jgi:hypothetical protein